MWNLPRRRGPASRLFNFYLIFAKNISCTSSTVIFSFTLMIWYLPEGKGTYIFRLITPHFHQAVQEPWHKSLVVWISCSYRKKKLLQAGGKFFHGTVLELEKSPQTLLLELSRLQGVLTVGHFFVASPGHHTWSPPDQSYLSILQSRPRHSWFYQSRLYHNTGVSPQVTHARLPLL